MNLFSPEFFVFFLVVLFVYYKVKTNWQQTVILIASAIFIASYSFAFLAYTYLFVLINYGIISLVEKYRANKILSQSICNTGIVLNIASLVFFKYTNFMIENLNAYLGLVHKHPVSILSIIIPLGISYYTFQGISYILQVYRGHEKLEKDFVIFSNYYLFFPKFLAGPIEQSKDFIPQLKTAQSFDYDAVVQGLKLMLWGAFKKMVVADRLALLINGVYSDVGHFSGNPIIITFLLQPLHLYCDFSGYTDIALGVGKAFGFKLTDNFNRPFFATSVSNFWRRWHISLSNWCNEYIFKRMIFKYRKWGMWSSVFAVFVTFFVIGIWHGPSWNYVMLGVLQAIAINYEFFTRRRRLAIASRLPATFVLVLSYTFTYLYFCFTLIFFNAKDLHDVTHFLNNMFRNVDLTTINVIFLNPFDKLIVFFSLLFILLFEFNEEHRKNLQKVFIRWPKWLRLTCYYAVIILIIYFGSPHKEFVYMQF